MAEYYDYVLALIPLTLVGIAALLVVTGWDVTAAVPVAAGSSTLLIGHALFVNGPVDRPSAETTGTDGGNAGNAGLVAAD